MVSEPNFIVTSDYTNVIQKLTESEVTFGKMKSKRRPTEKRRADAKKAAIIRRATEADIFNELQAVLPSIVSSVRRTDKTGILRNAVSYLKTAQFELTKSDPSDSGDLFCDFTQLMPGFLCIMNHDGNIIYVSKSVETYLGVCQGDMQSCDLDLFLHESDLQYLLDCALIKQNISRTLRWMTHLGDVNRRPRTYQSCHSLGRWLPLFKDESSCLVVFNEPLWSPLESPIMLNSNCYFTHHNADMTWRKINQNFSVKLGHMDDNSLIGESFFAWIHPEDVAQIGKELKELKSLHHILMKPYRMLTAQGGYFLIQTLASAKKHRHHLSGYTFQNDIIGDAEHSNCIMSEQQLLSRQSNDVVEGVEEFSIEESLKLLAEPNSFNSQQETIGSEKMQAGVIGAVDIDPDVIGIDAYNHISIHCEEVKGNSDEPEFKASTTSVFIPKGCINEDISAIEDARNAPFAGKFVSFQQDINDIYEDVLLPSDSSSCPSPKQQSAVLEVSDKVANSSSILQFPKKTSHYIQDQIDNVAIEQRAPFCPVTDSYFDDLISDEDIAHEERDVIGKTESIFSVFLDDFQGSNDSNKSEKNSSWLFRSDSLHNLLNCTTEQHLKPPLVRKSIEMNRLETGPPNKRCKQNDSRTASAYKPSALLTKLLASSQLVHSCNYPPQTQKLAKHLTSKDDGKLKLKHYQRQGPRTMKPCSPVETNANGNGNAEVKVSVNSAQSLLQGIEISSILEEVSESY